MGNPVCPHEELATIVGKCWVIHAFKRWGRESPREAESLVLCMRADISMGAGLAVVFFCFCMRTALDVVCA